MDAGAAVIEVLGRDGQVRSTHRVLAWPVAIGRAPDSDVVLDDAHLAGAHAQLELSEEGPRLHLLPSLNGGWLGRRRLRAGEAVLLGAGATFQLGATQLRLRRSQDALAPELPMLSTAAVPRRWVAGLLLLWLGLLWLDQWSARDPGGPWVDYVGAVLLPLGLLAAWAALWALMTQLFQHRFPFVGHLWRALVGVAGLHLLNIALPVLAYAFSWPRLLGLDALLFPLGLGGLLWWHASLVWPRAQRVLAGCMLGLVAAGLLLMVAKRQEQQYWFAPPYLSTLPPPMLRLAAPKPPEALIESLRPLEAELARQANKDNEELPADEGGDD
jgi:Inner membrane component of T3SS, cytoplasmic domain